MSSKEDDIDFVNMENLLLIRQGSINDVQINTSLSESQKQDLTYVCKAGIQRCVN